MTEITDRHRGTFYDWPVPLAEKTEWVNVEAFIEAFRHALEHHKGRYKPAVDLGMLDRTVVEARRITRGESE